VKDIKKGCLKMFPNCGETTYVQTNTQEQTIAMSTLEIIKFGFFYFEVILVG
jgi:hypothetical protein